MKYTTETKDGVLIVSCGDVVCGAPLEVVQFIEALSERLDNPFTMPKSIIICKKEDDTWVCVPGKKQGVFIYMSRGFLRGEKVKHLLVPVDALHENSFMFDDEYKSKRQRAEDFAGMYLSDALNAVEKGGDVLKFNEVTHKTAAVLRKVFRWKKGEILTSSMSTFHNVAWCPSQPGYMVVYISKEQ